MENKIYKEYVVRVYDNGEKNWHLNGRLHREDGPAIEYTDGTKYWFLNGKLHRENGPAIDYADGPKFWYLDGKSYSEAEYLKKINKLLDTCAGKLVEIDGKKYKLVSI